MPGIDSEQPQWAVYDETEQWYRDNPGENFKFYPVGLNAEKYRRLECFRHVANLPKEAAALGVNAGSFGDPAWVAVLQLDRQCPTWSQWEPGFAPREHFAEERSRKFTRDLKSIETRLTWIGITVAIIVGVLVMTPESVGWPLWHWIVSWWTNFSCWCSHGPAGAL